MAAGIRKESPAQNYQRKVVPCSAWYELVRSCRRQSGPLEPAPGLPGSATTHTRRYTTPRPSGKLHPQAVGGADGRYGGSPEGQTVMRAVPPLSIARVWVSSL